MSGRIAVDPLRWTRGLHHKRMGKAEELPLDFSVASEEGQDVLRTDLPCGTCALHDPIAGLKRPLHERVNSHHAFAPDDAHFDCRALVHPGGPWTRHRRWEEGKLRRLVCAEYDFPELQRKGARDPVRRIALPRRQSSEN